MRLQPVVFGPWNGIARSELRIIGETKFEKEWLERFCSTTEKLEVSTERSIIGTYVIIITKKE